MTCEPGRCERCDPIGVPIREPLRLYVAGPMTGLPQFNYPAFDAAAKDLRSRGHDVVSPAEMDDPEARALALASPDGDIAAFENASGKTWGDLLARDVKIVADEVDGVAVLDGWERSRGARLEVFVARLTGKQVLAYPDLEPVDGQPPSGEVRITNSATGGEKGSKAERYDLLPWVEVAEVARLYGRGAAKYAPRNWERGYDWSLSFAAAHRHLAQFWGGESADQETGCHHLASVIFHALALMQFERTHPELDDRPLSPSTEQRK